MAKMFGKLSKVDKFFIGNTNSKIFLRRDVHNLIIDLDNVHCRQTHWIKVDEKFLCLNCLQTPNCPGCSAGERVTPRFVTYGCELREDGIIENPGVLEVNQMTMNSILRIATTLTEAYVFSFIRGPGRTHAPIYNVQPLRPISKSEEDLIIELFSKCKELYNIELLCKPIKLAEWQAKVRGEVYVNLEVKKIKRVRAIIGGLK